MSEPDMDIVKEKRVNDHLLNAMQKLREKKLAQQGLMAPVVPSESENQTEKAETKSKSDQDDRDR